VKEQLPEFEGHHPEQAALRLTGKVQERVGALGFGEEVYVVVRAIVTKVGHGTLDKVFTRIHDAKATALYLVDPKDGERWLDEAALLSDERFGIQSLFGPDGEPPPPPDPNDG
jgi:hypothetical protein